MNDIKSDTNARTGLPELETNSALASSIYTAPAVSFKKNSARWLVWLLVAAVIIGLLAGSYYVIMQTGAFNKGVTGKTWLETYQATYPPPTNKEFISTDGNFSFKYKSSFTNKAIAKEGESIQLVNAFEPLDSTTTWTNHIIDSYNKGQINLTDLDKIASGQVSISIIVDKTAQIPTELTLIEIAGNVQARVIDPENKCSEKASNPRPTTVDSSEALIFDTFDCAAGIKTQVLLFRNSEEKIVIILFDTLGSTERELEVTNIIASIKFL